MSSSDDRAPYAVSINDDSVIAQALAILAVRPHKPGALVTSPGAVRDYLRLAIADREHEVFMCVFLDTQNKVVALDELFRGTLSQTSVYPREIVKAALRYNSAAVIFAQSPPCVA